jgi:diguanylate cyclase (GGDEF)-like protein
MERLIDQQHRSSTPKSVELLDGPLRLHSPFYIERPPLETVACAEIAKPGSLTRLKAPRHMGKSSLLLRLADHGQRLGYAACTVDFLQADTTSFKTLDQLLRWFSSSVARLLGVPPHLDEYWDTEIGSKVSCTIYFEQYLLNQISSPVVLLLNEVNRVFEHPEVASDFLSLLRFWHEQAQRSLLWQQLRLVMAYSTEVYIPLKLEQSPFNVGLQLQLPEFTQPQVQTLATRYDLDCHPGGVHKSLLDALYNLVGGHPYLIHLAIACLASGQCTSAGLLAEATSPTGIYAHHLRRCLSAVRQQPELITALQSLVNTSEGLQLANPVAYQLHSLGLIRLDGHQCHFSCELYRRYFQAELQSPVPDVRCRLDQLEQENQRLQALAHTDALTQIPNRRAFDLHLLQSWQYFQQNQAPLTLMLCDIDHFKCYNDTYGHPIGDKCLRLVAQTLQGTLRFKTDFLARYGGEEFAIILAQTDAATALERAEQLRSQVNSQMATAVVPGVTISIGVASVFPTTDLKPEQLIAAADSALYNSKRLGRDRITLSPTL